MATVTTQQANVIPVAVKTLYTAIINNERKGKADWQTAAKELCVANPTEKSKQDGPKGGSNKDLKGIRAEQFATLKVSIEFPDLIGGSEAYKDAMKQARTHFSACMNRALVALGYRAAAERKASSKAEKPATTPTATPAPEADKHIVTAMALQREIAERVGTLSGALAAFQTSSNLSKAARETIGTIAESVTTLADKVKALGESLVGTSTPEQAAADLGAVLKKTLDAMTTPTQTETTPA